jgi:PAS domain S-box-containing protein
MTVESLQAENAELRRLLQESEETLRAIREGAVDAFVVKEGGGDRIYTLEGADRPYRLLVEQMQQGALTLYADGTISYANLRAATLVGVPHAQLVGARLGDFVSALEQPAYAELLAAGLAGTGEGELHIRRADGVVVPVLLSLSVLPPESGSALGAVIADLTAQKHPEALAAAQKQVEHTLRQAARAKDEFLAMLGHELRNPVGAIRNSIRVLDEIGSLEGMAAHAREVIERQAAHLSKLLDDLLDVARVTTGKITLDRKPLDLAEVARGVLAGVAEANPDDRHALDMSAEPVWVEADVIRLEQIVSNLLSNALKYTPQDGRISVTVRADADRAVLRVEDSGIGIAPDFLPHVFDLFVQDQRAATRSRGGLGLGLTLVRRLVELHGGSIRAHSGGEGSGSVFEVVLPRIAPQHIEAPLAPAPERRGSRRRRVLIIEDNVDGRESLKRLLELAGHEVYEAEDGLRGVEAALEIRPEIALVDVGLPDIDGYEVARRVRAAAREHIRLIALTGYGLQEDPRYVADAGFDLRLLKPVDPNRLLDELAAPERSGDRGQAESLEGRNP